MNKSVFKALSDETRRNILSQLKGGPMSAGDIVSKFDMTNATISHHLSVLKEAGLISDRKEGKYIYYELDTSVIDDLILFIYGLKGKNDD